MQGLPDKLSEKLIDREAINALRRLPEASNKVDFSSNDYLGFSKNREIFKAASQLLLNKGSVLNGATGSRLLTGNHDLYGKLEMILAEFHDAQSALVFNSGYDANIGFFSSVPQRSDIVFYDEYVHASIRDGIKIGNAKSYKYKHNDLEDLKTKCHTERSRSDSVNEVYVVTESVFSMDGDSPDLKAFAEFSKENGYRLVVDEAHAVGVLGKKGRGLVQYLDLQDAIFARIVTFGKAIGCHGAAILGSTALKNYLVNFARSLIYTTGLPPHSVATVLSSYTTLRSDSIIQAKLRENISFFNLEIESINLKQIFIPSNSAIHCCVVSGNGRVKSIAEKISNKGFDLRPILSPTVPEGKERLRICLHSFNSKEEISAMLDLLSGLV